MTVAPIGSKDPTFGTPFIDVDEWRDAPVRHRYVHGGFEDGETRFSFYFPPAEQYEGRFFHPVLPMSGIEFAATIGVLYGVAGSVEFAVDSGAYLVESNMGRTSPFPGDDWTMAGYRASAAVARYSRVVAAEMYGEHRPYGYVFGGSGGALKTVSCIESTVDVWDGAVPFVMGTSMSMPNVFSVQAHAMRLLWDAFPGIVDAIEPGGSGDMYAGLTTEQREALAEVTRIRVPTARVVRRRTPRPRIHGRVVGAGRQPRQVGSRLLRGLLDGARVSRHGRARVVGTRAGAAQDDRRRRVVRRGSEAARTAHADGDAARYDHRRHPRRAAGRRSAGREPARRDVDDHEWQGGRSRGVRRRRPGRSRHHRRRRSERRRATRHRGRRRDPHRQLGVPRVPDVPPSPREPRLPGVGPEPGRRPVRVPAAAEHRSGRATRGKGRGRTRPAGSRGR